MVDSAVSATCCTILDAAALLKAFQADDFDRCCQRDFITPAQSFSVVHMLRVRASHVCM